MLTLGFSQGLSHYTTMEEPSHLATLSHRLAHKIVKHWVWLCVGCFLFAVLIYFTNEHVTAGIVLGRVIESLGDVAVDRGIASEL